ncbi:hypothetical protein Tco_0556357, partial [Tanacetum coccineum]
MDISKIIRKPSKTGKHGHEERKSTKEAKDSKPKPRKVNPWSILSLSRLGLVLDLVHTLLIEGVSSAVLLLSLLNVICMRTRSQARNRNRRQQQLKTVIIEKPEFPIADNRTMAQMLQAPIEGYEDAIVVPPINANNFELKQTLINLVQKLHQPDTFYNSLNTNDQDALDSAAGGNFLDKMPRDGLAIIESKSKVRYSRSRAIEPRVSTNAPLSTSTPSNSFEFQQLAASLEDKMDIRMS